MKKKVFVLLVITVMFMTVLISACTGSTGESSTDSADYEYGIVSNTAVENGETDSVTENNTVHEYVETYYIYAEQGAVITWFDPQTGEYSYKEKCETCGWTSGGEHMGGRLGPQASFTSSFSCKNSNCSMWGSSQPVKIGCEVSGEWRDVEY